MTTEEQSLLTVEDWVQIVTPTEDIETTTVPFDGTGGLTVFSLPSGWNLGLKDKDDTDLTEARMRVADDEYVLTKAAIMSITATVGLPAGYVTKTPGPMIQSHLNYWATHSPETTLKILTRPHNDGLEALAVTKEGITPFSNLDLLEVTVAAIHRVYGVEEKDLFVDFKSHHDLSVTSLRLILPEAARKIVSKRPGASEEAWSGGVQLRNSLTGKTPTSVQGYLFNCVTASGAITLHSEGKYNRKIMGQNVSEVLDWTGTAVGRVAEHMDHEFDTVEALVDESLDGAVSNVLADIFKTYKVPLKVRQVIIDNLSATEDFSWYGVLNAIIAAANEPGLPEHFVTAIMEIGGVVSHTAICNSCKRVID